MFFRCLASLATFAVPAAAYADIRATYADGSFIEINDDGAFRGNVVTDGHMMVHADGYNYLIVEDGDAVHVLDPVLVAQVADAMTPDLIKIMAREAPPLTASSAGKTSVSGREGVGYRVDNEAEITFVISDDPELNLVGQVISIHFRNWTDMQGPIGRLSAPLSAMFSEGAAIRVGNVDLVSLEEVEIDDAVFALPGKPLDFGATQEVMVRMELIKTS